MRILNLYAGIGGNAYAFKETDTVVAVEYDPIIAAVYKEHYPDHEVVVGDALEYLENHYEEFDFIWASPPCPSHSRARKQFAWKTKPDGTKWRQNKAIIPDMSLYGIIVFLQHEFLELDGVRAYAVENVTPYYEPLIEAVRVGRHLWWSNIDLKGLKYTRSGNIIDSTVKGLEEYHGFNLDNVSGVNKRTLLRNCVDKELAELIMGRVREEMAVKEMEEMLKAW